MLAVDRGSWSVRDAKNHFGEIVEAARERPQIVTKEGRPAVVIVAASEYERLRQLEKADVPSFVDLLLSMPSGGADLDRLDGRLRDP